MDKPWHNALAIINPRAGRWGSEKPAPHLLQDMTQNTGKTIIIRTVVGPNDARTWAAHARHEGFDLLIVCGGDGTVNEVVNGMGQANPLPIAILPSGSGNVLANELKIPSDLRAAARIIVDGTSRAIDVGVLERDGQRFIGGITIGDASRSIADARQEFKTLLGYPAYALMAFGRMFRMTSARFRCVVDGHEHILPAQLVLVANVGFDRFNLRRFAPTLALDDGMLDVFILRHRNIRELVDILAATVLPSRSIARMVHTFRGKTLELSSDPVLPFLVDGDARVSGTIRVHVEHAALTVMAPHAPHKHPLV